ncbi:MAG: monooxygenase family protein [Acidimicrobiia bacterium]
MAEIARGRHTADVNGGITVLLIGMRINNPLAFHRWIPVTRSMFSMLNDLKRNPAKGMRGVHMFTTGRSFVYIQYWDSAEALQTVCP